MQLSQLAVAPVRAGLCTGYPYACIAAPSGASAKRWLITNKREAMNMTELNKSLGQKQIEAARFAASHVTAEFLSSVSTVVKAKEDWEGGPVTIWQATVKFYSGDAFDSFPDPQSKEGEGENNP